MAKTGKTSWQLHGEYFETCSCDYLCPCIPTGMAARPTKGSCTFAMAFHIGKGRHGKVTLDGLNFCIVGRSPGVMSEGNWSVGLIIDERAKADQREAITGIASGQAGGPMAALAPLLGKFLGVETRPIRFEKKGMRRIAAASGLLDQAVEGVPGAVRPKEPLHIDNTSHPVNSRLALAKATHSYLDAFGLNALRWREGWDRRSGAQPTALILCVPNR